MSRKIKDCDCGCTAFVAVSIDKTYCVMCVDNCLYGCRTGVSKKTAKEAIKAWNKWARKGFPKDE